MQIASLIIGGLLLIFGRRLFWLFVGAVGFITGVTLAGRLLPDNTAVILVAGLVLGLLAAVLSVTVQRFAVLAAGFFAGGFLFTQLTAVFLSNPDAGGWLIFLVGGILGAVLISLLFDWALVIFSSLIGAVLITQAAGLASTLGLLLIAVLSLLGIYIQTSARRR